MIRRLGLLLGVVALGLAGLTVAGLAQPNPPADAKPAEDPEPPIRLKRKNQPENQPPAPEAKKPDPAEDDPDEPDPDMPEEIDEQEVLNRVSKGMRTAEERLGNKELGEGTR